MTDLVTRREVANLVRVFADSIVELGIREDPSEPAAELQSLICTPWAAHRADPRFASPLTESGAPFEISLQLDGSGDHVLRYVVDTADRRQPLAANLSLYFDIARATTAATDAVLRELFDRHLGGAPVDEPARVMHGVGFARGGRRRGSLYFPTRWLAQDELARRLNLQVSLASRAHRLVGQTLEHIEVVGYDFTAGDVVRWKTYTWLPLVDQVSFAALTMVYPSLHPAGLVYDAFVSNVPRHQHGRALFLQLAGDASGVQAKLFFFSRAWGWSSGGGLGRLSGFLKDMFKLDLQSLMHLRDAAVRRHFPLMLGLIAIGGDVRSPSLTFYFWPPSFARTGSALF